MGLKVEDSVIKTLVVARHGDYSVSGNLNELGRRDITGLADQLETYLTRKVLTRGDAIITYSLADRARESAEIMASVLGLTAILKASLGDNEGKDYFGQEEKIIGDFRDLARSYPCIIAITHEPVTAYLPRILHPAVSEDQGRISNKSWARVYGNDGRMATISPDKIFPPRDRR